MYILSRLVDLIFRFRWMLMGLLGGLMVAYELAQQGPGVFEKFDFEFLFEAFIFGLVLPLLGGNLLTNLAHYKTSYVRNKERLDRHIFLFQELAKHQDWAELKKFVAQYPASILPIEYAALYIYEHRPAQLEFASEWDRNGVDSVPSYHSTFSICQTCLSSQTQALHSASQCAFVSDSVKSQLNPEFCLPLSYQKM